MSGAITRTACSGSSNRAARRRRAVWGDWVASHRVRVGPSLLGSHTARQPRGSSGWPLTRPRRKVASTTRAAWAKAAGRSPKPWRRVAARLSGRAGCSRGAVGAVGGGGGGRGGGRWGGGRLGGGGGGGRRGGRRARRRRGRCRGRGGRGWR